MIIFLFSLVFFNSHANDSIAKEQLLLKKFQELEVIHYGFSYGHADDENFSADIRKKIVFKIDQNYRCSDLCKKNYESLSERMNEKYKKYDDVRGNIHFPSSLHNEKNMYYQYLYDSLSFSNPTAQLISTAPLTIRVDDQFYTNENWYDDFKSFYMDGNIQNLHHSFVGVGIDKVGAIWIPQLKKFFYGNKTSLLFLESSSYEPIIDNKKAKCQSRMNSFLDTLDSIVVYDNDGIKRTKNDLKGLILASIYKENNEYILHFIDTNKQIRSNLIDGVRIASEFLLTWYGYHNFISYKIPENEILDKDGKLVIVDIVDPMASDSIGVLVCPLPIEEPYYSQLKEKKIKFSDLPDKYKTDVEESNILYNCSGKSSSCGIRP